MQLFIKNLDNNLFSLEKLLVEKGQVLLDCPELCDYINDMRGELKKYKALIQKMPDDNLAPAPGPESIPETAYELVEAENRPYTIAQYRAAKWTDQQLIDAGHLIRREVTPDKTPPAPGGDSVPAAPDSPKKAVVEGQFELDGKLYMMTAMAAGASYKKFSDASWTIDTMIAEGYATQIGGDQDGPAETKTYPFLNAAGDWEDSAETIWDADKHSMGADKVPPVTTKGLFKRTRKKSTSVAPGGDSVPVAPGGDSVPVAPGGDSVPVAPKSAGTTEVSNIPLAPGGDSVPVAPGAATLDAVPEASTISDEPLDAELERIVKVWAE